MNKIKISVMLLLWLVVWQEVTAQQTTGYGFVVKGSERKMLEPKEYTFKPTGNIADLTLSVDGIGTVLIIKGSSRSDISFKAVDLMAPPAKAKGLRSVSSRGEDNSGLSLRVTQEGNRVYVTGTNSKTASKATFTIEIPSAMNLTINYESWGSKGLRIMEVDGDVEVKSTVGDVLLADVSGPLSVSTTGGNIEVMLKSLDGSAPTILSSSSGDIDVALSSNSNVSIQLSKTMGEVYTDLPVEFKRIEKTAYQQSTTSQTIRNSPQDVSRMLISGSNGLPTGFMTANLNKGGSRLEMHTISGDIYLRKR
ncbi:MAG: DUF4097 family beta strand repeat-containing protein [Bacteroidota bacterium]